MNIEIFVKNFDFFKYFFKLYFFFLIINIQASLKVWTICLEITGSHTRILLSSQFNSPARSVFPACFFLTVFVVSIAHRAGRKLYVEHSISFVNLIVSAAELLSGGSFHWCAARKKNSFAQQEDARIYLA